MKLFGSKKVYWVWVGAITFSALSQVISIYTAWGDWAQVFVNAAIFLLNVGALLILHKTAQLEHKSTVDAVRRKFNV